MEKYRVVTRQAPLAQDFDLDGFEFVAVIRYENQILWLLVKVKEA